jgi:undecaprenyl-diphosphatase
MTPLYTVMYAISEWGLFLVIALVFGLRQQKAFFRAIIAGLATFAITFIIKEIVMRPRPFMVGAAALIGIAPEGWSFPSMHAALAFAAATSIVLHRRSLGWLALAIAALVAIARVYLGVHYWSDVIAGAILGSAVAYATDKAFDFFERGKRRKKS